MQSKTRQTFQNQSPIHMSMLRRFLFELDQGTNCTAGLDLSLVDTVLEAGMTAAPGSGGGTTLFAHTSARRSAAQDSLVTAGSAVDGLQVSLLLS